MGMWKTQIWTNDTALDWLEILEEGDSWQVVEDTLKGKMEEELCDDEGYCIVAAGDVVAAGAGQTHPDFQEEAAAWVEKREVRPSTALITLALEKVDFVRRDTAALGWNSDMSAKQWDETLRSLEGRLRRALQDVRRS